MSIQKMFRKTFVEWLLGKMAVVLLLVLLLFGVAAMLAAGFSPAFKYSFFHPRWAGDEIKEERKKQIKKCK